MDVTFRIKEQILYIDLNGRIDASNANEVEEKIFKIKEENPNLHVVLDADHLEYISSAGLRVILKLKKSEEKLAIINVAPEVYEIFDMTGFTDIVKIEKAYRRMSVEGCDFLAKGANGAVYRYDDETILKVYYGKDTLPAIEVERANARKAFILGINTAIPYGIVRVGEEYGTVTELLNATSISKLIKNNQDDIEQACTYYVDLIKHIHSIEVEDGQLDKNKEKVLKWIDYLKPHLPIDQIEKLKKLVGDIPDSNCILHGDYHTNNVMIQNNEPVLIDLDTLSVGHPIFELAYMYNALIAYSVANPSNVEDFLGYPLDVATRFWRRTLEKYFNTTDQEFLDSIEEKAKLIGYIRTLRHTLRNPKDEWSDKKIAIYKKGIEDLSNKLDKLSF